ITLSVIALPQMLAAGYDKRLAIGTIASAGTLGILIPPAIMLVVMAEMLATSAGNLFLSAIMPGLLLSGLYLVYIVLVAIFRPGAAPPPPVGSATGGRLCVSVGCGGRSFSDALPAGGCARLIFCRRGPPPGERRGGRARLLADRRFKQPPHPQDVERGDLFLLPR